MENPDESLVTYYGREPTKKEIAKHKKQHDEWIRSIKEHQKPEWKEK